MYALKLLVVRTPGIAVLLFNYFLMNTGFFLLVPFLALHGTRDLGLTATLAGVVLGIRQFVQQALALFGGALGDRFGYKPALAMGLLVRAAGFASFAFATDLPGLIVAALIAALGGAFFESTGNAALATLTPTEQRPAVFSLYGIAARLGSAAGPVLGIWLLQINFAALSLVASAFYVIGFILLWCGVPSIVPPAQRNRAAGISAPSFATTFMAALRNRPFVTFVSLNAGYWFLFAQFGISLPLYVFQRFGSLDVISAYYLVNLIPAVLLQFFLLQYLNRRWPRARILVVAMCLIALGIGTIGAGPLPWLVVLSASVYALGDLLYQPTQYTITAELARGDMLASYFGFAALALAFGGGAGNVLGGALFDLARGYGQPSIVWYGYGIVGLFLAIGLGMWAKTSTTKDTK